jgi:hypothetical protein
MYGREVAGSLDHPQLAVVGDLVVVGLTIAQT